MGIDRETTDLVAMLDDAEGHLTGGSTYFKFKEEQELSGANRDEVTRADDDPAILQGLTILFLL